MLQIGAALAFLAALVWLFRINPASRRRRGRSICPGCGLTYIGQRPCPYCTTWTCTTCSAHVPVEQEECPYCGGDRLPG